MAKTYAELLAEALPSRIDTAAEHDRLRHRLLTLLRQLKRTAAERKLIGLLTVLVEDYDRRHALPPDELTPAERLLFLMERSGKNVIDLLPVFGERSRVHDALTGRRRITSAEARRLGEMFRVKAAVFSFDWHG